MHFQWHTQTRSVHRFSNANQAWSARTSTLIVARDLDGAYGIGEATPLPGYSSDSSSDVEQWLRSANARNAHVSAAVPFDALLDELDAATLEAPPSAAFAVQAALLDLWSKRKGSRLTTELLDALSAYSLNSEPGATSRDMAFAVAPLLDVYAPTFKQEVTDWLAQGLTTFKIKIGSNLKHEAQALQFVESLARSRDQTVRFRLDANQSLNADSLGSALTPFARLPVEYIEEPCALAQLTPTGVLPLPLALDESLQLPYTTLAPWLMPGRLSALVCKPMIVGGVRQVLSWCSHAKRLPCAFVLSHLFDGPIAFRHYKALAAALAPQICHGLFPHAGLELWSGWLDDSPGPGLGLTLTPSALDALSAMKGPQ